ncbi:MAG: DMT family transporter [Candidatus Bathyarchaeia archaeon]
MTLEIGILFAIVSMLSWGTADFFAKKVIDKIGCTTTLVFNLSASLGPILVFAVLFSKIPPITIGLVSITVVAGVLGIIGYIFLYRGFQKGKVSVVSPISASWAVITTLLAIFLFKEELTLLQIIGIIVIFVGVFLTSTNLAELKKSIKHVRYNGIMDGIISMIAWGIAYAVIKPVVSTAGPIMALFLLRAVGTLSLFSWVGFSGKKISRPTKLVFLFLIIVSALDTFGFAAYNVGITTEFVSIVSPVAATYPAVTILLAYLFLKERVVNNQKIGVVAILAGLALISIV